MMSKMKPECDAKAASIYARNSDRVRKHVTELLGTRAFAYLSLHMFHERRINKAKHFRENYFYTLSQTKTFSLSFSANSL